MRKHFFTLAIFAVMCAAASSCRHLPVDPTDPRDTTYHPVTHNLTGTEWRLYGLAVNGGHLISAEKEIFTLKFTTASHAEGTASCNGYGADFKADAEKISFSNLISTLAYCGDSSLDRHFIPALQSAKAYSLDRSSLIIFSTSGVTLYFQPLGENHTPDNGDAVHFADFSVTDFKSDPFQINGIRKIDDTHIAVKVSYSGGCHEHDFALYADENIMPGNATDFAQMMITHDAHGDMCEAWITKELVFDISPLIRKWRAFPHSNHRLLLQFSQHPSGAIEILK